MTLFQTQSERWTHNLLFSTSLLTAPNMLTLLNFWTRNWSHTLLILLFLLLFLLFYLLLGQPSSKKPKPPSIVSRDEIWQRCFWSKYALTDRVIFLMTSNIQDGSHDIRPPLAAAYAAVFASCPPRACFIIGSLYALQFLSHSTCSGHTTSCKYRLHS